MTEAARQIRTYIDDFKLMMIAKLAAFALLLVFASRRREWAPRTQSQCGIGATVVREK